MQIKKLITYTGFLLISSMLIACSAKNAIGTNDKAQAGEDILSSEDNADTAMPKSSPKKDSGKYRVGKEISAAYVNPDEAEKVPEEDLKATGYDYDYDTLTYDLVWSDEFDYQGAPDESKWSYDVGGSGWGNHELQYYTEGDNAYVDNGYLIIEARKEKRGGCEYTSSRLVTKNKGDWLYCKVEVYAKLPSGLGTWPAIWMLPTDYEYGGWPNSGEIDIMEHVGYNQDNVVASVHTKAFHGGNSKGKTKYVKGVSEDFHLYTMEWLPDKIIMSVDGVPYFTYDPTMYKASPTYEQWPFDRRMHLLLNIAFGGDWGGAKGIDDSILPVQMVIDYVRVYQSREITDLVLKK